MVGLTKISVCCSWLRYRQNVPRSASHKTLKIMGLCESSGARASCFTLSPFWNKLKNQCVESWKSLVFLRKNIHLAESACFQIYRKKHGKSHQKWWKNPCQIYTKFDTKSDQKLDRKLHRIFDDFSKVLGVIFWGIWEHFGVQKPFQIWPWFWDALS